MAVNIGDVLNTWNDMGVFSYVFPGLLIFAVVFAILEKSKLLGVNRPVNAIASISIAFMSLMFDFVPTFFNTIFPRFGIVLSIFLVIILMGGLFYDNTTDRSMFLTIGIFLAIAGILWALSSWNFGGEYFGLGPWFQDNFWAIIILILVASAIYLIARPKDEPKKT